MIRALLAATALTFGSLAVLSSAQAEGVTVAISCSSLGIELQLCQTGADAWAKQTGNQVKLVSTPPDANERLSLYQTLLAAHSKDIDVFQIDAVWPGILATHFIDLADAVPADQKGDFFPTLIANDTVDGKLVAVPWFADAGLLYYRKDLLDKYHKPVPTTWAELADTAKAVMDGEKSATPDIQGYVWQGRSYEGLTCNALEWVYSYGGGTIVDDKGKVSIDNPQAIKALEQARTWIGTISPAGVLNYSEEESRGVFQSGKAVFMRNWPYAWSLANAGDSPIKDKVGIAVLPQGDGSDAKHAATLGGQQLAVSKYSVHPKEAADLVRYLTGADEEKRRAIQGSFNPSRKSVYSDKDVQAANPFFSGFQQILENAVARPSTVTGQKYNQVSSTFFQAVHGVLSGQSDAKSAMSGVDKTLDRVSHRGRW
ncbi:carbohydrate ABC transporter substrate-binding protein, CUT1 family [Faunimonas pinastri]|uniref:Carbohydrate ABC transporter substrate-binding protein, CUT1 family n=1 Tax=Faunimonas pinastri TaxID=1855383 RepID=A0A1H9ANF6_9HYPH|nr:ABC transporter substrate-binding protein [Faunimonas pinastri]SEP78306.1 carbohydrate ABC transporter substrate-binding protein, CUT1 family [Faunimonas pinastri]